MPRDGSDVNGALETSRGDRGARVKAVRIAGPVALVDNPDLCAAAPAGGYETGKPRNTCHLVLPASNERRERRVLIVRDDCIERLEAPYTVHHRSGQPFRVGVDLRVHAGLPLENLPDKPAANIAAGDARQEEYPLSPIS